ncbi:MAG TPA: 16S rRNA (cytidine(1402)-2'-O)-methyltransferase [Vicinamibacterales bacterium]|nr:16S rRNA (cytidine(1402)-2'-O)-methyltransferase [Vicinamibacterales bacterium]
MGPSTLRRVSDGPVLAPGTLFVVATPIGNLEDITLRALRVLREVALVAAEDTRRTGNLLRHYQIETPLVSLHEHNEHQRIAPLVRRLQDGESIAVVSDAGTPGISDPGARLVRAAREAAIRVDAIPGPSAITAVLSASGLSFERFAFAGFPPVRSKNRTQWFQWVASLADVPVVCFEAPHRIRRFLADAGGILAERPIILARELTKAHEEWWMGAGEVLERGEFVVIIGQKTEISATQAGIDDADIALLFGRITETMPAAATRRATVRAVAAQLGLPVRAVYEALERAKKQPA